MHNQNSTWNSRWCFDNCTDKGLLILDFHGTEKQGEELACKVAVLKGVTLKLVI